jgi:hypothetical protein
MDLSIEITDTRLGKMQLGMSTIEIVNSYTYLDLSLWPWPKQDVYEIPYQSIDTDTKTPNGSWYFNYWFSLEGSQFNIKHILNQKKTTYPL